MAIQQLRLRDPTIPEMDLSSNERASFVNAETDEGTYSFAAEHDRGESRASMRVTCARV